ncbi:hypothetical protein PIB30_111932, partial [Stylosanthes scabra]|nr:hypothetical protein [Stylosanthes scabra]
MDMWRIQPKSKILDRDSGVPAHAWGLESARKIGNVWGRVLEVFESDLLHYNSIRVYIEAKVAPNNLATMDVIVDNDNFLVMVKECGDPWRKEEDLVVTSVSVENNAVLGIGKSLAETLVEETPLNGGSATVMGQVKTTLGGSEVSKTKTFEDDRHTEDMESRLNKFLKDTGTTGDSMKLYTNNNVPQKRRGRKKKKKAEVLG